MEGVKSRMGDTILEIVCAPEETKAQFRLSILTDHVGLDWSESSPYKDNTRRVKRH